MTSSEAALNDEELIKALQYLVRVTKDYDQEHMIGADYKMIPTITKQAADRIEELTNTHWQVDALQQNALLHDALTRAEVAEAKLANAVQVLRDIVSDCEAKYPPSHGSIKYAICLTLAELEKTE